MSDYVAPLRDMNFVLQELLDFSDLKARYADLSEEFTETVLNEAGKFAEEVFAPLNRIGDTQGVSLNHGEVIIPDGFTEAYAKYVESGWQSLAQDPAYGGQGLPFVLHMAVSEMWNSACTSLALCPLLTAGGIEALTEHASEEIKNQYLEKLVSGEWTATMNLTEPHAGSDLSQLKTKAYPEGDHYLLKGQKIFITWGEHSMADNILHIVLAPLVDAPPGIRGLSLFLVPRVLVSKTGELLERNDVRVISVEKKLGIHGSPTCVMSFGEEQGAVGYLIGEPGQGLACMFTLMNHARLEVGLQGVALAERAYQDALGYALERTQGTDTETGESAKIIQHADVRRMLMQMKSMTEAMRAMAYDGAISHNIRHISVSESERSFHEERFGLLTPVIKAWNTELVNEITSLAIQVHGGMGFIEETGVAQHYRDARIAAIYEGTNGIQANDLVSRKLIRDQGAALGSLISEMLETADKLQDKPALNKIGVALAESAKALQSTARFVLQHANSSPHFLGSVSFNFLMMMGYVCGAWYMSRSALIAGSQITSDADPDGFYRRKLTAAQFYIDQVLPRYQGFQSAVQQGHGIGSELSEQSFL